MRGPFFRPRVVSILLDKKIWRSALFNGACGFSVGALLTLFRYGQALTTKSKESAKRQIQRLKKEWASSLTSYPLFLSALTYSVKLTHRLLFQANGLSGDELWKIPVYCSTSFLSCFVCQAYFPVLSWDWCLYITLIPVCKKKKKRGGRDIKCKRGKKGEGLFFFFGKTNINTSFFFKKKKKKKRQFSLWTKFMRLMALNTEYWLLAMEYSSSKIFALENVTGKGNGSEDDAKTDGEKKETKSTLQRVPSRNSLEENYQPIACLQSLLIDGFYRFCNGLRFYGKFFGVFGGIELVVAIVQRLQRKQNTAQLIVQLFKIFKSYVQSVIGNATFLILAYHVQERHVCLWRFLLYCYHRLWRKDNLTVIAYRQKLLFFALSQIFGYLSISCVPSESRKTDFGLFTFSKAVETHIRWKCNVETNDDYHSHPLLGNTYFSALLLATAFGIGVYLYHFNKRTLKSVERKLYSNLLE
ncbi:hypothetical protein RFI_26750 [Reticulomyxa filosa]|uniref:Transmembrane protein n=1 Tax=Reticulomyxa filosa TaxID=46433 RepID=X6M9Q9_RETFI|nr:hypothetical protein RFI_26750 [Reticulomyxa filosa]|eukprot:ETO10629.1 hypothetical protein RFI_26750 [Reticulomyxa filosa]